MEIYQDTWLYNITNFLQFLFSLFIFSKLFLFVNIIFLCPTIIRIIKAWIDKLKNKIKVSESEEERDEIKFPILVN